jgi:KUP system potassium uptake protein
MQHESEQTQSPSQTLILSLGALGVVFGDIGTSPMYALAICFNATSLPVIGPNILGVVSLIFWSLIIVVSIKYMLFITRADNDGEGGIFAIFQLLKSSDRISKTWMLSVLTGIALCAAALLFADGLITPALSIMSALEGLKVSFHNINEWIVLSTLLIIIGLFSIQRFGTSILGGLFGPVMLVWFSVIAALGFNQILKAPQILQAFSPHHALRLIIELGWLQSLELMGCVILAITGAEAIYADMGHFGRKPIKLAWYGVALLALMLNYFGQGAYLLNAHFTSGQNIDPFFDIVPIAWLIPMVVLGTLAGIIASQAIISGIFTITSQAIHLNYLPRLLIKHTSKDLQGQIYIPKLNILLTLCSIALVLGFESSENLASAYGFAVAATMFLTSIAFTFLVYYIWNWSWMVVVFCCFAIPLDFLFLAATVTKIPDGSYVSILISLGVLLIMVSWIIGDRYLMNKAQRIALLTPILSEVVSTRKDLHYQARPAIFFQHLSFPAKFEIAPNALLRQIQLTSIVYQPTVIVEFCCTNTPRVAENDRLRVIDYPNDIHLVSASFGFAELISLDAVEKYGQEKNWWKTQSDIVFYSAHEDLRNGAEQGLPPYIKWPFIWLHSYDQNMARTLNIPALQYVELSMPIDV